MLRENFIAQSAFIKKLENSHTRNLKVYLKTLKEKEANTHKRSRWQEIIKLGAEINKIKTKRTTKNQQNQELVL